MSEMGKHEELLLTPEERASRVARTILEAQLFLDGASISPTGALLLTDTQRENVAMTGNPLTSSAE